MNLEETPVFAAPAADSPQAAGHWKIALLCALVAVCDGFDTQAIAFVAPVISKQWGVAANLFGPVFSAGLVGLALGAFFLGSAADRLGRKRIILFCVLLFGLASILTIKSSNMTELAACRILTGLGLGGVLPNLIAMTNESASPRRKNAAVMLMFCGFPLGATIGGLISAPLIAAAGWSSVFILGGVAPLCLLPFLVRFLPNATTTRRAEAPAAAGKGIAMLFSEGRAVPTLLLWAAFFSNLLVMYFLVNWLPLLLGLAGLSLSVSTLSTAVLNLAGIGGALVLSRVVDSRLTLTILAFGYVAGIIALVMIAGASSSIAIMLAGAAIAGAVVVGGQIAMNAVTASFYPAEVRSTGVGWALGIGRIGSITGPLLGGSLMKAGWQGTSPVLFAIIPLLIASAALFALRSFFPKQTSPGSPG